MRSLADIFKQVTSENYRVTDKNRGIRRHSDLYEILFKEYRESATKVFEIGVNRGGSIRVWREYFSNATIYGIDIIDAALKRITNLERIVPVKLDQSNPEQLESFALMGPFDIGIDDGSHAWSHQTLSFKKLWPAIKPGGLYVIEDVVTSYDQWLERKFGSKKVNFLRENPISCVEFFKKIIDEINFYGADCDTLSVEEFSYFQKTIDWLCFRSNSIFLRKRLEVN